MTRPSTARAPTMQALRKEARRVLGRGAKVEVWWHVVDGKYGATAFRRCHGATGAEALGRLRDVLAELPSATPKRRGKGEPR